MQLTDKGIDYCKKSKELKEELEKEISDTIGKEKVEIIKELLNKNWIIK